MAMRVEVRPRSSPARIGRRSALVTPAGRPLVDVDAVAGGHCAVRQLVNYRSRDQIATAHLDSREAALPEMSVQSRLVEPQFLGGFLHVEERPPAAGVTPAPGPARCVCHCCHLACRSAPGGTAGIETTRTAIRATEDTEGQHGTGGMSW